MDEHLRRIQREFQEQPSDISNRTRLAAELLRTGDNANAVGYLSVPSELPPEATDLKKQAQSRLAGQHPSVISNPFKFSNAIVAQMIRFGAHYLGQVGELPPYFFEKRRPNVIPQFRELEKLAKSQRNHKEAYRKPAQLMHVPVLEELLVKSSGILFQTEIYRRKMERVFEENTLDTIRNVVTMEIERFQYHRRFGPLSLIELERQLQNIGLHLGMYPPPRPNRRSHGP